MYVKLNDVALLNKYALRAGSTGFACIKTDTQKEQKLYNVIH